jgi:hypothetical protein
MGEWENGRSRRRRDARCSTSNGGRGEQTWERWMRDPPRYGQGQCVEGDGEIDGGGGSGGDDGNERWEADESRCGGGFVGEVGEW